MRAFRSAGCLWEILPNLFRRENEYRRSEPHERIADFPNRGLRGAARLVLRGFRVEAIFQHVKVKRAEVHDAVIMDGVVDAVEFVIRVPFAAFLHQFRSAVQHPPVDFFELVVRERVARRIKISQVSQREAEGVANLAIGLGELGHHPFAHLYVRLVFDRCDPEAQQVRTPLLANLSRGNHVTERLGHRPALLVERPAVRDDSAIRRRVARAGGHQQRAMEPAAILIRSFEVNIGGPFRAFQYR